ncbi:MAG TPA: cation diffusion facilitator family transporter [Spirochaetota bacterium]|nr:cation diffusion facilitator family transporter [Spirochaetota bacterium]HPC39747.1 cation diffusion facilitator family transporter [Spirochaetota bacterium]HPL18224.1 cation diffusion facilitator family transporter [Spirochaetota bacterium]HQF07475.1 cation diffusion facilitator family transporter [Spirochaetota bacterium]HQH96735.1 cation diffusion facilitator family transporter [Spirochaetota bacterium]
MSHNSGSLISIFLALGANALIAISKFVAALVTGSGAMLAEAVHSSADCANQGLLLYGIRRSKKPANPEHPLGYGMAVYFWSFIVAIILFSIGGLFSIYEGILKMKRPEGIENPAVALAVLGISIVLESISLAGCLRQVNKTRGSQGLLRWFRTSRQSELLVVFGEDIAALTGLSAAFVAIVLTLATGDPFYDALGSVVIGIILVGVALSVGNEVKNLLIGQSTNEETRRDIYEFLSSRGEIKRVLNVITLQMGPDIMVAVKAEMNDCGSIALESEAINACESAMKQKFPNIRWSFFEPDVR